MMKYSISLCFALIFHGCCVYATPVVIEDIDGRQLSFFKEENEKSTVFVFTTVDCPIANSLSPTIRRIFHEFQSSPLNFVLVYVDKDLSEKEVRAHGKDYGLSEIECIVIDREHQIINVSKADITPQAAIFGPDHQLKYIGAINNLFSGYGDKKAKATQHYLRDNLKSVLAQRKLPYPETKTYGCYIPKDE